jgi:hypothetical protein
MERDEVAASVGTSAKASRRAYRKAEEMDLLSCLQSQVAAAQVQIGRTFSASAPNIVQEFHLASGLEVQKKKSLWWCYDRNQGGNMTCNAPVEVALELTGGTLLSQTKGREEGGWCG